MLMAKLNMPLEGIRVLDWTVWQVGGRATSMLGSLGAEIIKLERKDTGLPERYVQVVRGLRSMMAGGHSSHHEIYNRNKKSLAIDLKHPGSKEVIQRLVEKSDVFVQNFSGGVAQRLGLDYKALSQYNPRLIYANASSFGPDGPEAGRPGMNHVGLARSGLMMMTGDNEKFGPQTVGAGLADESGAIFTAYGVVVALLVRERMGIGQEVDASMLGGCLALQELAVTISAVDGRDFPSDIQNDAHNPLMNWYKCKDGKWISFSHFAPDPWWPTFCRALGLDNVVHDPRFKDIPSRSQNRKELITIIDKAILTKTRQEWMQIFEKEDLIYSPVNTIHDLYEDPQILANDYIVDFDHPEEGKMKFVGLPVRFSKTPGVSVRCRAPEWGEHSEEILTKVAGYSKEKIAELREKGVI